MSKIDEGTDWYELFYEEDVEVNDTIEVSESQIMFTTTGGTKFTEYKNYRRFEIIEKGDDVATVQDAIDKLTEKRENNA